jgi:hypothetical protein
MAGGRGGHHTDLTRHQGSRRGQMPMVTEQYRAKVMSWESSLTLWIGSDTDSRMAGWQDGSGYRWAGTGLDIELDSYS